MTVIPSLVFLILNFLTPTILTQSDHDVPPEILTFQRKVRPLVIEILRKNNLEIGYECVFYQEEIRRTLEADIVRLIPLLYLDQYNISDITAQMLNDIIEMSEIPGSFCNSLKNLECNTEGICTCQEETESFGFHAIFERENDDCVFSPGSLCIPPESTNQDTIFGKVPKPQVKCSQGTKCILKRSHESCTLASMESEFKEMMESSEDLTRTMEKFKKGICFCGATIFKQSIIMLTLLSLISFFNLDILRILVILLTI